MNVCSAKSRSKHYQTLTLHKGTGTKDGARGMARSPHACPPALASQLEDTLVQAAMLADVRSMARIISAGMCVNASHSATGMTPLAMCARGGFQTGTRAVLDCSKPAACTVEC